MQSGAMAARRCVIWFGEPSTSERSALAQSGWSVRSVHAPGGELRVRGGDIVVAMADLRDSDDRGLDAMGELMAAHPRLIWLALVSSRTSAQAARVQRILQASVDFFTAPVDIERLIDTLGTIVGGKSPASGGDIDGIVGRSPAMRATLSRLRKFAPVDLPVLITGETGTGKEGAAKALHHLSVRSGKPFVAINCGALPVNLVQSELFGHERGAFTGANARRIGHIESAAGGTVFLDEIGDLPLDAQTSLLRFLQEGTIERLGSSQLIRADARVIAATHVDLEQAVAAGRFREDLYYRLNVLRLPMPPLRDREGDVELLAQHFLDRFREHHACRARGFGPGARAAMRRFGWPGNVRELINRVQRAAVIAEDALVSAADLDLPGAEGGSGMAPALGVARVTAEREAIMKCLRESRFNISECARRLRISRVTVYRLCKKHRLALDELR
ncbi:sigma 54-interacting transcriptional regulator [Dyella sp.]|uniref:sigma-54 dependent transcriptional regulator n=1 Tax=Dyella sp. TaxID=1869338 RepID=UPI003F7DD12E